jgi:hypothetical protein
MRYYNYMSDNIEGGPGYGSNYSMKNGMDPGAAVASGASGFAAGGPVGAAIGVGGSFLSQYLNQRHQEEQARKKAMWDAAQYEGDARTGALKTMLQAYGQALR